MADTISVDSTATAGVGHIVRIIGAVVDVKFKNGVPNIYNALTVDADTPVGHVKTILEVESQLPGDVVRTVAMTSTDGLQRGLEVVDTGAPMKMPVGKQTLSASGTLWVSLWTARRCPRSRITILSTIPRPASTS